MSLRARVRGFWISCQQELFPWLEEELGPVKGRYERFIQLLELAGIERFLPYRGCVAGCPPKDRAALARAFMAKPVFGIPTTSGLIERLEHDALLRRLCGWERVDEVPSESTFSRVFAEFASGALPQRAHEALIAWGYEGELVVHVSRDSTAIEAREKATPKPVEEKPKRKRGRPRKGEKREKEKSRVELQLRMTLPDMIADLPSACDVGVKRNAKGYKKSWTGYKLHIDAADGGVPISCLLTSASLHDSQAAIPLAAMTSARVDYLYDLMDSAYDTTEIGWHSWLLGHVPIIDVNPRDNDKKKELEREAKARRHASHVLPEELRYNERSNVERVNGRFKDDFGGRHIRVRGHRKVFCHVMFAILALTADQMMRMLN